MGAFFITATGTDIGKTYLACGLIKQLRAQGQPVEALKPVLSGFDAGRAPASDAGRLLAALGRPVTEDAIARISPWRFAAPLAPLLAARREGRNIDFEELLTFTRQAAQSRRGILLVEGIGGIMVPINAQRTAADWMQALRLPVLLVAGSYLGSVSHTLTCLEVLRRREIPVRALIVNETPGATVTLSETIECVAPFAPGVAVLPLRRQGSDDGDQFGPICSILE